MSLFTESSLQTHDGITLYSWKQWPGAPQALILLVHGMGEHSRRYKHVADFYEAKGIAMAGFDLRGHGKSGGKRGHTPSYRHLMNDISTVLKTILKEHPGLPVWIYGHSLGGNLTLNYAVREKPPVKGYIVTSPYLRLAFQPPAWKISLGKFIGNIFPGFTQKTGLDVNAISRDPQVVADYKADPLVHDKITARFFNETHPAGEWVLSQADQLNAPVLLMHGTADRITDHKASAEMANGKGAAKIRLKLWEGLYHETHNEPEKAEVLEYTHDWLKQTGAPS